MYFGFCFPRMRSGAFGLEEASNFTSRARRACKPANAPDKPKSIGNSRSEPITSIPGTVNSCSCPIKSLLILTVTASENSIGNTNSKDTAAKPIPNTMQALSSGFLIIHHTIFCHATRDPCHLRHGKRLPALPKSPHHFRPTSSCQDTKCRRHNKYEPETQYLRRHVPVCDRNKKQQPIKPYNHAPTAPRRGTAEKQGQSCANYRCDTNPKCSK